MAGRRGGARGLVLGLALMAAGVAALSQISVAEPLTRSGAQAGQAPSFLLPRGRQRVKTNQAGAAKQARDANTSCGFPWSYSRGLGRCICTRDGYSLQRGNCLPDDASTSCADNERWSPKRSACVCAKGPEAGRRNLCSRRDRDGDCRSRHHSLGNAGRAA